MNNYPCNKVPVKFVSCCDVMDCIDMVSSDNSVTIEKSGCGIDITQTGNNLDQILSIEDSGCITWVKEFIDGVLTYTPQLDIDCITEELDIDDLITIGDETCLTFTKTVVDGVTIYTPVLNYECLVTALCSLESFEDCIQAHQILPTPETTFAAVDSSTIAWTPGGTAGHTPSAAVKVSATAGNAVTVNVDGIYVAAPTGTVDGALNGLHLVATDVLFGGALTENTEVTNVAFNMKFRNNAFLLGNLTDVTTFTQPGGYGDGENRVLEGLHKINLIGTTGIPYNFTSGFVYETGLDQNTHQFLGASFSNQFHFNDTMAFGNQTQDSCVAATICLSGNTFTAVTTTYPISGYQAGVYLNDPAYIGETDSGTPGTIDAVAHYSVIPINNEPGQSLTDSPLITNLIGLNIEDQSTGSAYANVTNSFAILQKGANDISRFFGPVQNAASAVQFTSDIRVKENVADYTKGLAIIDSIDVKSFNYTYNKGRNVVGVIAQELEQILPEAIEQGNFETPDKSISFTDFRMVDQNRLFYTMLNAIKELSAKVKVLEQA